jgi:hypothetical protein
MQVTDFMSRDAGTAGLHMLMVFACVAMLVIQVVW